jgi:hypothetical protein
MILRLIDGVITSKGSKDITIVVLFYRIARTNLGEC